MIWLEHWHLQVFLRMCFNVFAHNRDDHAKNFTYLYDESSDGWRLRPAYDLCFENGRFTLIDALG